MDQYREFFLTAVAQPDYSPPAFQRHFALSETDALRRYKSSLQWVMKSHVGGMSSERHRVLYTMAQKYIYKKNKKTPIRTTIRGNNNIITGENSNVVTGGHVAVLGASSFTNGGVLRPQRAGNTLNSPHTPQAISTAPGLLLEPEVVMIESDSDQQNDPHDDYDEGECDSDSGLISIPSTQILPRSPSPRPFELAISAPYHHSLVNIANTFKHPLQNGRYLEDHIAEVSQFSRGNNERHALLNLGIVDLEDHVWLHYGADVVNRLKWGLPKALLVKEFYFIEKEFESYWESLGNASGGTVSDLVGNACIGGSTDLQKNDMNFGKLSKWYRSAVAHLQLLDMLNGRSMGDSTVLCGSPEHSMLLLDSVIAISGKFQRQRFTDTPFLSDYLPPSSAPLPTDAFTYVHIDRRIPFAFVLPVHPSHSQNSAYDYNTLTLPTTGDNRSGSSHSGPYPRQSLILSMHTVLTHLRKTLQSRSSGSAEDVSVCAFLCFGNRIDVLVLRAHGKYSQVLKLNRVGLDGRRGKDALATLWQMAGHMDGLAEQYCALFSEGGSWVS
ncbi:hypothetical protein DFH27DRAFT_585701 [Peziza echinospora]|nr:hypothetical protein DFH27DRAFT_585701 [Peziza echinospora]